MATISTVSICNMALSNIGADSTVESLTADGTAESNACNLWYDWSRLQALAGYDWSFARKRLTLATHSEDPPDGVWAYRYQYPSDCIAFRHIVNPAGETASPVPYEVEADSTGQAKSILTDLDDAVGVYTFDQETVAMFTPLFVDTLSHALAHHIAFTLTGKLKVKENMLAIFRELQSAAPSIDANEQGDRLPRDADWITGRA